MVTWQNLKQQYFTNLTAVKQLLLINIAAFALVSLVRLFSYFFNLSESTNEFVNYLYVPGDLRQFIFRIWTPLTYQFMHTGIFHILFNMVLFYFMGTLLFDFLGSKKVWTIYVLGGITAALVFIISFNVFPVFSTGKTMGLLVGASGSVMAITAATATLVPQYEILLFGAFRVKLKWLALGLILIDIAGIPSGNPGGGIAHLGGAFFGIVYVLTIQGKINNSFINFLKNIPKRFSMTPKTKLKKDSKSAFSNSDRKKAQSSQRSIRPNQNEIDAILDKISNSGYDSLTKSEKELLFKASE